MRHSRADAAERACSRLLDHPPGHGPSAVCVGIAEPGEEPLVVTAGAERVLTDDGEPGEPVPLSGDPVFDVGSVTKVVVTTALAMTLADRDPGWLDARVGDWWAPFRTEDKQAVTVRDLLEHQGGLWEWWPTYIPSDDLPTMPLQLAAALPLRHRPHAGRHYSDLGFLLLGDIVAREVGATLDIAVQRHVFDPLGMADSGYRPAGRAGVVATSVGDWYERRMIVSGEPYPVPVSGDDFTGWRSYVLQGEANDGNCWHGCDGMAGHAGLFTTVRDLLRLGTAIVASTRGDGSWSEPVVAEFLRPGRDPGQALGFRITGATAEHPGFPGAWFGVTPESGRVVVLLTNRLHTTVEPLSIEPVWRQLVEEIG